MPTNPSTPPGDPTSYRVCFRIALSYALLAVVLGAFGAHALADTLAAHGSTATWKTAVDYQIWHALAVILWISLNRESRRKALTPYAFLFGILLFSGSLYALALGGPRWLGPITPLGGLSFMIGWTLWLWTGLSPSKPNKNL
jgi:uncharacterized membrane protein YgdD (TMEM256/DUF423 family)